MTLQESGKVREITQFSIESDRFPMRWDISDGRGVQLYVDDPIGPQSEKDLQGLRRSAMAALEQAMTEAGVKVEDLVELPMPRGLEPPEWADVFARNGQQGA